MNIDEHSVTLARGILMGVLLTIILTWFVRVIVDEQLWAHRTVFNFAPPPVPKDA